MSENKLPNFDLLSKLPMTVGLSEKIIGGLQAALYKGMKFNSFEPYFPAKEFTLPDGHHMVTEIKYGETYMNSFLDITYPTEDKTVRRPTVFYTHGGGFFGGSKAIGDPMAIANGKTNFMFDDIVNCGFNFVNVDYVLVPEGHFPDQLHQLTQAIDYCAEHAEELGLDMTNVAVMGSSAGAVLTGQYGALLANAEYRERLGITPKIDPAYIKCLVLDDCPYRPEKFNWKMNAMMGTFLQTLDLKAESMQLYNAYAFFNENMKPSFFDAGPKDGFPEDMTLCSQKLTELGVENELFIPTEELPHGFMNLAQENAEAAECEKRMLAFLKKYLLA